MSKKCLFDRASGLFAGGTSFDDLAHDPATHIQLTLPDYPDPRTERWDGATGTRAATAQELADFDAVEQRKQDISALLAAGKDTVLVLVELVDWLLANTAIVPTDFTPQVRQAYLDLKAIADRVKT